MGFIVSKKLKILKQGLKDWSREIFGEMDAKVQLLTDKLKGFDLANEEVWLQGQEVERRESVVAELWALLKNKKSLAYQRFRVRWLKEGDANSKYFHACVRSRITTNHIFALLVQDEWVQDAVGVKNAMVNYYTTHFSESIWERSRLDGIMFKTISGQQNNYLVSNFEAGEIEDIISQCDGNKSPRPDGFNFSFYKACWSFLKGEMCLLFSEFHRTARLPRCLTSYFLALILKISNPRSVGDFRPISLLGSVYKLISKVLATRLGEVMESIFSVNQSTFIKKRHIADGVVVINDVIDLAKKRGNDCLIF